MKFEKMELFENSRFFKFYNMETNQDEIVVIGQLYNDLCITTMPIIAKETTIEQYNKMLSTYRTVVFINSNKSYIMDMATLTEFDYIISLSSEFKHVIKKQLGEITKPISDKLNFGKVILYFLEMKTREDLTEYELNFVYKVNAAITEQLIFSKLRGAYPFSLYKLDVIIRIHNIIKSELERIVRKLNKKEDNDDK